MGEGPGWGLRLHPSAAAVAETTTEVAAAYLALADPGPGARAHMQNQEGLKGPKGPNVEPGGPLKGPKGTNVSFGKNKKPTSPLAPGGIGPKTWVSKSEGP